MTWFDSLAVTIGLIAVLVIVAAVTGAGWLIYRALGRGERH